MSKTYKIKTKYIGLGLGILAVFTLALTVAPFKVNAEYEPGYDDGYDHFLAPSQNPVPFLYSISPKSVDASAGSATITITGHGFTPNSVARLNGADKPTTFIDRDHLLIHLSGNDLVSATDGYYINVFNPGRGAYSSAVSLKVTGSPLPIANNSSNGNYSGSTNTQNSGGNTNGSSLAGAAIFGAKGVFPSGLVQWVLFAIVILLIVILVRRISGAADRYHNEPLKHA